jgi:hypothetical protein
MTSVTLSFVDERQFLTVIYPVPAHAEFAVVESPPADPALAEPLHSVAGTAQTETS